MTYSVSSAPPPSPPPPVDRSQPADSRAGSALFRHIAAQPFPCVGAKSALARDAIDTLACGPIDRPDDDARLHAALVRFAAAPDDAGQDEDAVGADGPMAFRSFAAMFSGPSTLDEAGFERALWARAQALSDLDRARGFAYDRQVSSDPSSPDFALSFGGAAFFLIGMHPHASRPARRFARPVLIFNPHRQFAALRAAGRYERLRERIIARDVKLAGTPNPMLARHGESSEARQYSGRAVGAHWSCPFSRDDAR